MDGYNVPSCTDYMHPFVQGTMNPSLHKGSFLSFAYFLLNFSFDNIEEHKKNFSSYSQLVFIT